MRFHALEPYQARLDCGPHRLTILPRSMPRTAIRSQRIRKSRLPSHRRSGVEAAEAMKGICRASAVTQYAESFTGHGTKQRYRRRARSLHHGRCARVCHERAGQSEAFRRHDYQPVAATKRSQCRRNLPCLSTREEQSCRPMSLLRCFSYRNFRR